MYKHTKFFVKRQAESGIFYPICIIGPLPPAPQAPFPPEIRHAGQSRQPGALPHRSHRPAPDGVPSDQTAFPSLTSGPPFSQRAPLFFRPSDLPSHNDRAISHPDERLLSLTNIPPGGGKHAGQKGRSKTKSRGGKVPGRKAPGQKAPGQKMPGQKVPGRKGVGAETAGMESAGTESAGTESAGKKKAHKKGGVRTGTPPFTYPERAATTSHRYCRP